MGYSIDCFLKDIKIGIPFIYSRILYQYALSIVQLLWFLLIFIIVKLFKLTNYKASELIATTLIYLFIYL